MTTNYDPNQIARDFDQYGIQEWNRLVATPVAEVSLYIHTHYLKQYISRGMRVLEIGAGAGRFTQILASLGAKIVAADISAVQLDLNRKHAEQFGFAPAVENWLKLDISSMEDLPDGSFDAVVAYGGPLSYVLDRRDLSLKECLRILRPEGVLFLSVMSVWGSAHRSLIEVLDTPEEINRKILTSGDISPQTFPGRTNYMHLFRSNELLDWLYSYPLQVLNISASNFVSTNWDIELEAIRRDAQKWAELLEMELMACAEPGSLNAGTHIIAVARKK